MLLVLFYHMLVTDEVVDHYHLIDPWYQLLLLLLLLRPCRPGQYEQYSILCISSAAEMISWQLARHAKQCNYRQTFPRCTFKQLKQVF